MKPTPAEHIVGFLSFSSESRDHLDSIAKFGPREWKHAQQWLDDAGLAFYFLQKVRDANAADVVPATVLTRLERNFASNRGRIADMAEKFKAINLRFDAAGVHYAVVKGFSLVPEFCPYAPLRHQGDLDYLVDQQSSAVARQVLTEVGYNMQEIRSSQETIFVFPGGPASRSDDQYSSQTTHAVELHTDMWNSDQCPLPPIPSLPFVHQTTTYQWNELTFAALSDEDAFLVQVLHVCTHLFSLWIRTSNLFEIAYFLNRRASDFALWHRLERRIGDSVILQEFVVVVAELASKLFASPVPLLVQAWGSAIRSGPRLWIDRYARSCALSELPGYQFSLFPRAKLVLFLQQQYPQNASSRKAVRKRLLPSSRLSRIVASIKRNPSLVWDSAWWKGHRLLHRSIFHALSGARYLLEIPRWMWLSRTRSRPASARG